MNYLVICWLALDERGPFLSKQASYDFHCWLFGVYLFVCVCVEVHTRTQTNKVLHKYTKRTQK